MTISLRVCARFLTCYTHEHLHAPGLSLPSSQGDNPIFDRCWDGGQCRYVALRIRAGFAPIQRHPAARMPASFYLAATCVRRLLTRAASAASAAWWLAYQLVCWNNGVAGWHRCRCQTAGGVLATCCYRTCAGCWRGASPAQSGCRGVASGRFIVAGVVRGQRHLSDDAAFGVARRDGRRSGVLTLLQLCCVRVYTAALNAIMPVARPRSPTHRNVPCNPACVVFARAAFPAGSHACHLARFLLRC